MDTMVCTESTKGVAKPANTRETSSKRCQSFARPVQPKLNRLYIFFWNGLIARSRIIAKSGSSPVHQHTKDTARQVEIAHTSHSRGEVKLTQRARNWLRVGSTH